MGTLGRGGVGTTYEAEDLESAGKRVVLKQLNVRNLGDWKLFELFEREARTLAQLVHPAIPRYLDSFQTDDDGPRLYIVQELAKGRTLADLVAAGYHPDEGAVREIAVQVLRILGYLQSLSPPVIHRDVKPQNILRSDAGEIALVDFGAVKSAVTDGPAGGSTVAGTFGYMAPEQLHGHATTATDLYGLGATLVFLLTRRSPPSYRRRSSESMSAPTPPSRPSSRPGSTSSSRPPRKIAFPPPATRSSPSTAGRPSRRRRARARARPR